MYQEKINAAKDEMSSALKYLKDEFAKLKAGKANPAMIENLMIDYYGTKTPLLQLATINIPEPRIFIIQPYDKSSIKVIEGTINTSDLGINANVDKDIIRIVMPELTEDRRKELVKMIGQKAEEARIAIRNIRERVWKEIKDLEGESLITEDDKYKAQEELDKIIGEFNNSVKELEEKKENELMKI